MLLKNSKSEKCIFAAFFIYINCCKNATSEKITHKIINTKIICASKIHIYKSI